MNSKSRFFQLHTFTDGKVVYINAERIAFFTAAEDGGTILHMGAETVHVQEDTARINGKISFLFETFPEPF